MLNITTNGEQAQGAEFLVISSKSNNNSVILNNRSIERKSTQDNYIDNHICPICHRHFIPSKYLATVFKDDPKALFIANLITHYRHHHIKSWNRCWEENGRYYRRKWFGDYDAEKSDINERAKRQIIRKATAVLIALNITSATFLKLQNTDEKTILLAKKNLDCKVDRKEHKVLPVSVSQSESDHNLIPKP